MKSVNVHQVTLIQYQGKNSTGKNNPSYVKSNEDIATSTQSIKKNLKFVISSSSIQTPAVFMSEQSIEEFIKTKKSLKSQECLEREDESPLSPKANQHTEIKTIDIHQDKSDSINLEKNREIVKIQPHSNKIRKFLKEIK